LNDFEKISHLIRFGLSLKKMTPQAINNWADRKIAQPPYDFIFLDLSSTSSINKIIEILSTKVVWDFENNEIRNLILSYYREYLNQNLGNWPKIQDELLAYYSLFEFAGNGNKTDDFLFFLEDDWSLRKGGFGGMVEMPSYLKQNLIEYDNYRQLRQLLASEGIAGYEV
jgi:hypothetical protein